MEPIRWIVAVTGASGIRYGLRLLEILAQSGIELHVVFSDAGLRALSEEEGITLSRGELTSKALIKKNAPMYFYNPRDIGSKIASGSFMTRGMIICPCTMGTLAAVAQGLSINVIHRAADVVMKERRTLIVVPRETPLSVIHIENMLKLARAGAIVCPAMPGFYHRPKKIDDIVDLQVMKILDLMGVPNNLVARWGEEAKPKQAPKKIKTNKIKM